MAVVAPSPDATETSPASLPSDQTLHSHKLTQETTTLKRRPRSSVDDSAQTGEKKHKRSDASALSCGKSNSSSSRITAGSSTQVEHQHDHGGVRTLPPWIDSFEDSNDDLMPSRTAHIQLATPSQAHQAQHHYAPTKPGRRMSQDGYVSSDDETYRTNLAKAPERGFFGGSKEPDKGRKWDHARKGDPVILQTGVPQLSSPWMTFVKSSQYGPAVDEEGQKVDDSFLDEQTPGYVKPWRGYVEGQDPEKALGLRASKKRRRVWYERIQYNLLMHPLVPLAFRIIVLTTSTLALAMSSAIYQLTRFSQFEQNPSTIMAIVVDVVAMPYIGYITWDEYTGKPLGLRSPKAKIRLVLLDLFFIIFESANLALAFAALTDENGSCQEGTNGTDVGICQRAQTLGAFLFIALVAWIATFSVSIFRLVERVGGREEND